MMMEMKDESGFDSQQRSDDLSEIMETPLSGIVKYGTTILLFVFILLVAGSCLFKYPDVVTGNAIITTENPPVWVVSQQVGAINQLYFKNHDFVESGTILAEMSGSAKSKDVFVVRDALKAFLSQGRDSLISESFLLGTYELGSLQTTFSDICKQAVEYNDLIRKGVTKHNKHAEAERKALVLLKAECIKCLSEINEWDRRYILRAPQRGVLSVNHVWRHQQYVRAGEKVCAIIPEKGGGFIGKVKIPESGVGKINAGQSVSVRVNGYPYAEFGCLKGSVKDISLLPDDEYYYVTVEFTHGLYTTYHRLLNFKGEMSGQADIVTEDRSLFERIINSLKIKFF